MNTLWLLAILGHDYVRVTQVASHNLRPCAFAQLSLEWAAQKLREMPLIAGVGRVRISVNGGRKHSGAN